MATYDWHAGKAAANERKHNLGFREASTVFADPLAILTPDPDHSVTEERWVIIGLSNRLRVLVVVYVERHTTIRIISARRATSHERENYEEGTRRFRS